MYSIEKENSLMFGGACMEDYNSLKGLMINYFSNMSEEDLKKKVFPRHPELFNIVAEHRGFGKPWNYRKVTEKVPVNNEMIFFESNLGKQYTGNPRYIYERMIERYPNLTYVWCYEGKSEIPGNPIIVSRASEEYYKLLAQSRYIINNTTFPLWYHRPETFYLQTWHGTPFKKLHWDITSRPIEKRSTPEFYTKSTTWNALLSPNAYSSDIFRSAFKYEGPILEYGYPANDIFYQDQKYKNKRKEVRASLGIKSDSAPVFLYAPTWRDGKHLGDAMFEFDLLLNTTEFIKNAPKDAILLIRSHHMSSSEDKLASLSERVINVSDFDDATELMCAADVLITDYSSIVFDWYCSKKPVIYYVPDYEDYVGSLRGSYFDLHEYHAGPICKSEDELYGVLKESVKKKVTNHQEFYKKFCDLNDGNSSDRVIDYLFSQ